jgi:cytochrome c
MALLLAAATLFSLPLAADAPPAAADIEAGKELYDKCVACHSPERNRTGPLHCGIFGRISGTVSGFAYSDAMRGAKIVWNAQTLDRFLEAPLEMVPGTTMGFAGVADGTERRLLIAWLGSLTAASRHCDGAANP